MIQLLSPHQSTNNHYQTYKTDTSTIEGANVPIQQVGFLILNCLYILKKRCKPIVLETSVDGYVSLDVIRKALT